MSSRASYSLFVSTLNAHIQPSGIDLRERSTSWVYFWAFGAVSRRGGRGNRPGRRGRMRGEGAGRPGDDEECLALPYEPFPPLIHLSHPPTLLESTLPSARPARYPCIFLLLVLSASMSHPASSFSSLSLSIPMPVWSASAWRAVGIRCRS